jgi:precorrin-6B methylase 2
VTIAKSRTRGATKTVAIEKKMARMIMIRKNLKGLGCDV